MSLHNEHSHMLLLYAALRRQLFACHAAFSRRAIIFRLFDTLRHVAAAGDTQQMSRYCRAALIFYAAAAMRVYAMRDEGEI